MVSVLFELLNLLEGKRLPLLIGTEERILWKLLSFRLKLSILSSMKIPHFGRNTMYRIRPLSNMERVSQGHGMCVRQESSQSLVWLGHPETRFTFDHIACEAISQETLFRVVGLPMVENCMSGYNSCMFAYGQTGSGKTYTMMGEMNQQEGMFGEDCGITPRTFEYLFSRIRQISGFRRMEHKSR